MAGLAEASDVQGSLTVSQADLTGLTATSGPLGAFELASGGNVPVGAPSNAQASSPFSLRADALHLVVDEADIVVHGIIASQPQGRHHSENDYHAASVTGIVNRPGYWFVVQPMPGHAPPVWTDSITCNVARPTNAQSLTYSSQLGVHATLTADVQAAVHMQPCAPANATITGDFVLALWQWDVQLDSLEGRVSIPTGMQPLAGPSADPGATRDQEAFLEVTHGALTVPSELGDIAFVYVQQPEMVVQGRLDLHNPVGTLVRDGVAGPVGGLTLHLEGSLKLRAGPAQSGIPVAVSGQTAGPTSPATMATSPGPAGWLWLDLLGAALVAIAIAALLRRRLPTRVSPRRRAAASRALAHAHTSAEDSAWRQARRWATRAIRLDPSCADAYAVRARCHGALGKADLARRDHQEAQRRFPADEGEAMASNALTAARTFARLDLRDDALAWLDIARRHDPTLHEDAEGDPALRSLLGGWPSRRPRRSEH